MRCLIFGGNRFIGKKLAARLSVEGHDVTVLNRSGTGPDGCDIIKSERDNLSAVHNDFDLVIDFCLFKPEQTVALRSFLKPLQRYIFVSSAAAYLDSNSKCYNERMSIGGRVGFGEYGKEKAECEKIMSEFSASELIVRPPYIVGNDCPRPRLRFYIEKILSDGKCPVAGDGNALFSLVWSEDVVNVLHDMVTGPWKYLYGTAYNVSSSDIYSTKTLIKEISEFLKRPYEIIENSSGVPFLNEDLITSTVKLNWEFKPIKYRLKEFCEYSRISYE
jgi:nucleoside-diphosphate-sugar epimerase